MSRLPKVNKQHQFKPSNDDFLLGDISQYSFENVLLYSVQGRKIDNIDKTNCLETHGFDFLNEFLDSAYYMFSNKIWTHNTFICSVLHVISPKFSLLKSADVMDDYIFEFRKQMGLDIDEKGLYKRLELTKNKIKRKILQEILFRNPSLPKYNIDMDDDLSYVSKYICLRFKIGLLIVNSDKSYKYIIQFPKRLNLVLLKTNNKYFILCNTTSDSNLFSNDITNLIVKSLHKYILTKLNDIKEYTVEELKVIAAKLGINCSKNKSELYEDIKISLS